MDRAELSTHQVKCHSKQYRSVHGHIAKLVDHGVQDEGLNPLRWQMLREKSMSSKLFEIKMNIKLR